MHNKYFIQYGLRATMIRNKFRFFLNYKPPMGNPKVIFKLELRYETARSLS